MNDIPWIWMALRGSGIIAWALLTAVVVWGLLMRTRFATIGTPLRMFEMHKWLGILSLSVLTAHLALVLLDSSVNFTIVNILVPFTSGWEPFAIGLGVIAMWFMLPVSVIGRIRSRLGKAGNVWFNRAHKLSYAAWPLATGHYLIAGTDAATIGTFALITTGTVMISGLLVYRGWVGRKSTRKPAPVRERVNAPVLVGN